MAIVDNFEKIRGILDFDEAGDNYYFVQIMQRRREHPELKKPERVIKQYAIGSLQYFDDHIEEIKKLCEVFRARAYIAVNPNSYKEVAFKSLREISDILDSGNYYAMRTLFASLSGKYQKSQHPRYRLIDIDTKDADLDAVTTFINSQQPKQVENKIIGIFPSVNGYHIITRPFDPSYLRNNNGPFKADDIHKEGNTILYANV